MSDATTVDDEDEKSLINFLEPDNVARLAREFISDFRANHKEYADGKIPLKDALRFWEEKYGPLVPEKPQFDHETHNYLLPAQADSEDRSPFLDLSTADGGAFSLTAVIANPKLCPTATRAQLVASAQLRDLLHSKAGRSAEKDLFSIDTAGTESVAVSSELRRAFEEKRLEGLDPFALGDGEESTAAETEESPDAFLKRSGGKSLMKFGIKRCGDCEANPERVLGYKDIQNGTLAPPIEKEPALHEVPIVRQLIEDNTLQSRRLNDKAHMKALRKDRSLNEKEDWGGMKRREISPEERAELLAIDLRGTAKSGFYQFGIVRDGGLEKPVVVRDNDGQIERSPKKPKSLVKSIIVK